MAFPPQFLDELRARLPLAGVIGRRVRLVKRGREFVGLCPFHNEKTPSFCVIEDKGFFHCFGCGAHGDVIGFTMRSGNLGFVEAVESLAAEAGLAVPKPTPEARERAARATSLQAACEAAARHFEAQLWAAQGRRALDYLRGRGLDDDTIRQFRLGLAPDARDGLKRALGKEFPEAMLVEAGLLRRAENGDVYDYFRGRVMFPIGDRAGRVIAFGGRILGEGQPKYLNSPETPLFHKGRVLYGWAAARAAAARENAAIVTEGYMDVIALHRAGFKTAVAPLGTALTEGQLDELWKLAPEPVLCFDGDAAGQRAALRAIDRALPLLRAGQSLRFATLPAGEDPDTVILRHGPAAMRHILAAARPMAEVLWASELGLRPLDTPERRADLERRLEARVRLIADRTVQENYRRYLRDRVFAAFRPKGKAGARRPAETPAPPRPDPGLLRRRQQEVLLATLINHPALLDAFVEDLAALDFAAPDLDKLRNEIINIHALHPDLDAEGLARHLDQSGFSGTVDGLLSPQVFIHAGFARREADDAAARRGWLHTYNFVRRQSHVSAERARAEQTPVDAMTEEALARLRALPDTHRDEDGPAEEMT